MEIKQLEIKIELILLFWWSEGIKITLPSLK